MRQLWRRARFVFQGRYWWIVLLFAVVALAFGWFLSSKQHPVWGSAFVGVGTSMLAAMLVSCAGPDGDKTYRDFLQMGVKEFYGDRSQVPNDSWVDWLESAQRSCILFGVSHNQWIRDPRFEAALVNRLTAGTQIQIFFLDPNDPAADTRQKEDRQKLDTKTRIRDSITRLWEIRGRLTEDARDCLAIYAYQATPSLGVTWVDDWMLVTHYLAGFDNRTSPALRVEPSPNRRSPYVVYAENVEKIRRNQSERVTDSTVGKYISE